MSKNEVLLMCPLYAPTQRRLEETYQVHPLWTAPDQDALIRQVAPTCRVVVTSGGRGIDAATLAKLPHVKLVSCFGVGVDAIDLGYCASHGITVTNTPDVLTDDVADLAVALMIASLRKVAEADRFVRAGKWLKGSLPLATTVTGRKVGIVGMGRIGQAIAGRCRAFKTEIGYYGPRRKPVEGQYFADLVAMAAWADVMIAACPGGAATRGLVSGKVLEALGPNGHFVNISRGSVVDEKAMVRLLTEGKLGGAGLDVFEDEPRVPAELMTLESVVLQPHQGSGTAQTRQAMGDLTVGNVDAFFAGKPLLTVYSS
jgi:lactate dehydrogenase-like 2-hydroxyacid dehydrogenase